ncbi:Glycosyl hydrolases family 1, N-terminal conserved site [Phytophthora cactorum]|nr:Glycosyl hydrolases family 1, N-terminal conserved site [Phytophthora cactorum]
MVFSGADFQVSKAPVASVAIQAAAKKTVNDSAKKTSSIRDFAAELQRRLEPSMGSGWHVLVGGDFAVDLRYRKGACVLLFSKTSKMKVLLYRTTPSVTPRPKQEHEALTEDSENLNTKRKIVVFETDMEDEMKEAVIDKAKRLYNYYEGVRDNETKIAQALKHSLTFAYGPTWQVVVSSSRELCCLPIADEGTHVDFMVKKLRVVVYRHAGISLDRQLDSAQFGKRVAFVLATICLLLYGFLALNSSEVIEKCKGSATVAGDNIPVDGVVLPEGCTAEEVKRANDHAWWKTAAILGMSAFTMLASLIRMYSKSLTPKVKRAHLGGACAFSSASATSTTSVNVNSTLCFPSDFLFGTASSAFQAEGGWNATNKEQRRRSDEERRIRHVPLLHLMGRAMSWNETTQRMQANSEGLAFYHSLINELLANGIQPIMTLYHWDLPATLQSAFDPPGWLNEAMIDTTWTTRRYLRGVRTGRGVLDDVQRASLVHPHRFAYGTNAYQVAHVVLLAHAAAVKKFHELRDAGTIKSTARISIVINSDWGMPLNDSFTKDVAAAERKNQFHLGWFLSPLTTGDYPPVMRERLEQSAVVKGSYDLLMLNYYASYATTDCDSDRSETNCSSLTLGGPRILELMTRLLGDSGYPPGYIQVIRFLHEHDTSADILLTENGWCGNETIDNPDQIWYHRTHLEQVHKAIYEEDIPIIGYTVWSFMDGFEWTNYAGRRGLYYVNYTDETGDIDESQLSPRSSRVFNVRLVLG